MASQTVPLHASRILRSYAEKTRRSQALHLRAKQALPDGITHLTRYLEPHPLYIARAAGSHKWDVDGNEYVDYFGGHGALLLGHNHPAVMAAATAQLGRGSHYGAAHELEIQWAELVRRMVPSAGRVRFTSSGTEATHLALRLARAFTGKNKIIRFIGHFHGWHDHVSFPPGGAPGVVPGIVDEVLFADPNDVARVDELLGLHSDVAALILEPTGATFGKIPTGGDTLRALREITSRRGALLIFDEVISGFRCSPGGAQQFYGVTPDLTTLAKILAGGHPGGAVAGREDVMALLEFRRNGAELAPPRVPHQGTFNAAPVSAAAGIATLELVRDTDPIARANLSAAAIRDGMNAILKRRALDWNVHGRFSEFHIRRDDCAASAPFLQKLRAALLLGGVDIVGWPGGLVSAAHTDEDVPLTVEAFEKALEMLAAEGEV